MIKKFLLVVAITLYACKTEQTILLPTGTTSEKAMVVSAREEASRIGIDIMAKGGNAFDAMVATELALAVSFPYAGNIGGGGLWCFENQLVKPGPLIIEKKPQWLHIEICIWIL